MTLPLRTSRAAATMSSGRVWLSVPISSRGPHLPQFLYFSAASRRSCRVSLRAVMALEWKKTRRVAYQAAALAALAAGAGFLISNTAANLAGRHIASGFGFLGRDAGFEIGESFFLRYDAGQSYLKALAVGVANTLTVSAIAIVLATLLGAAVGFRSEEPRLNSSHPSISYAVFCLK